MYFLNITLINLKHFRYNRPADITNLIHQTENAGDVRNSIIYIVKPQFFI